MVGDKRTENYKRTFPVTNSFWGGGEYLVQKVSDKPKIQVKRLNITTGATILTGETLFIPRIPLI
jgi:hypothetical protein